MGNYNSDIVELKKIYEELKNENYIYQNDLREWKKKYKELEEKSEGLTFYS